MRKGWSFKIYIRVILYKNLSCFDTIIGVGIAFDGAGLDPALVYSVYEGLPATVAQVSPGDIIRGYRGIQVDGGVELMDASWMSPPLVAGELVPIEIEHPGGLLEPGELIAEPIPTGIKVTNCGAQKCVKMPISGTLYQGHWCGCNDSGSYICVSFQTRKLDPSGRLIRLTSRCGDTAGNDCDASYELVGK